MAALFGPSEQDLEHLRTTVESLGTTSVPGLAAALAWRERKTEKTLAHELARPGTRLIYDPARRVVRWKSPIAPPPAAAVASSSTVTPVAPAPLRVAARSPPPVLTGTTLKVLCPSCHVALIPTGSASLAVCPQCGRLASSRSTAPVAGPAPAASPTPRPATAANPAPSAPAQYADRRSQEMFAAYVTSKPIPCPKCRTALRHRGLSEYVCPACAQTVQFPVGSGPAAAAPAPSA